MRIEDPRVTEYALGELRGQRGRRSKRNLHNRTNFSARWKRRLFSVRSSAPCPLRARFGRQARAKLADGVSSQCADRQARTAPFAARRWRCARRGGACLLLLAHFHSVEVGSPGPSRARLARMARRSPPLQSRMPSGAPAPAPAGHQALSSKLCSGGRFRRLLCQTRKAVCELDPSLSPLRPQLVMHAGDQSASVPLRRLH